MSAIVKAAMVTGHHRYDVVNFQLLLRSIPEVDFYPQHMEDFVRDTPEARRQYDVVAFYNYQLDTPGEPGDELGMAMKGPLEALGETDQGILFLHHSLTAFPKWRYWLDMCGMEDPTLFQPKGVPSHAGETMGINIVDPKHPITEGMASWKIVDETYNMADATEGSEVVLTTDYPDCMSTIAWTRKHRNARVFSFQSGHDNEAWSNPMFKQVLARGVLWCAGRI